MELLTGKCKEDFLKYASYNYGANAEGLVSMRRVYRYALIVDFFDSVGIRIILTIPNWWFEKKAISYTIYTEDLFMTPELFKSRLEATEAAIKKANDIFNETN